MDINEFAARMRGQLDAMTELCIALLVTHPNGNAILLTTQRAARIKAEQPKNAGEKPYLEGMAEVFRDVEAGLAIAAQAVQIRDLKPEGGH